MSGLKAKHNEAAALVAQMSLSEKTAFASGKDFWHLEGCDRLELAPVMVTDGPHGLRKQRARGDHIGLNQAVPATCFPTASALAASWDVALLEEVGVALGEQCVAENVTVLLGPGLNIKRHPLCGRNFEYFSEDPLISGEMAAAMVRGVQSQGVGTSIKHFAVNNQEWGRMYVDAVVDERTLREIYLRGFEIAVKHAQPWTVMCAYNRVNGEYCSEHNWLLNEVLRDEWGFEGLVVTDWGAANDRVRSVGAGLDLEMPASGGVNDARLRSAVERGDLEEALLDRMITRNVALSLCGAELADQQVELSQEAHHKLAHRAAAESAVLLKNEGNALPLSEQAATIAVIGAFARKPRYQGTGSSQVNPTQLDCAYEAMAALVGEEKLLYAAGYEPIRSADDDALLQEAIQAAEQAEVAVVFAGLPVTYESEGFDRAHMRMPRQHDRLIQAVCEANANTVVVLSNGAPVEMPWVEQPRAILEAYLPGQAGGAAIADLLFGHANPSGKLAETFPLRQADVPADRWFPGEGHQVQYREGLYVGYRYFDTAGVPVLFPFGHGLSYTQFEYGEPVVTRNGDTVEVRLDVSNTGIRSGAEVVQLYVHDVESTAYRPQHELRTFAKVVLEPGVSETVIMTLNRSDFAIYDEGNGRWQVESGEFELRIGASSRDIRQRHRLTIHSTDVLSGAASVSGPEVSADGVRVSDACFAQMLGREVPAPDPVRPFHLNSPLKDVAEHSWLGRRFKEKAVAGFMKSTGMQDGVGDPTLARMFEEMANHMPLRSFVLFSGGRSDFREMQQLLALLNHRYLEALRIYLGRETDFS